MNTLETKAKYTPGPWRPYKVDRADDFPGCYWRVNAGAFPSIAILPDDGINPDWIGHTTAANARLIAAAPELAEVLRDLLAERMRPDSPTCTRARAALKAAGVEP